MKRLITTVLLLVLLAGAGTGAFILHRKTVRLREENQAVVDAAREQVETAKAGYDALDPNTNEGAERQLAMENQAVADAQARADALWEEITGLEGSIQNAQKEVDALEADEENAYYLAVYDVLREGMEKVEGYIEGN